MNRRCARSAVTLGEMIDREIERVFRSFGFAPRRTPPAARRRHTKPRRLRALPSLAAQAIETRASAVTPPALATSTLSPELQAYVARFPPFPPWMKNITAEDLVLGVDPDRLSAMADAEDGEQPWDDTPLAQNGKPPRGYVAFPFVGPPDESLD
jgi:hypothetical protein